MKRAAYLRRLRELIGRYGSENIVYFDETGFVENVRRESGWAVSYTHLRAHETG